MFVIFANVNFIPGKYDEWIAAYKDLEAYVVEAEKDTCLTYYFGIPEFHGNNFSPTPYMFAYEAYGERDDLYKTHMNSDAIKVFLSKIPAAMTTGLDLTNYEVAAGFLDKPGDKTECAVIWDTRLWIKDAAERDEVLKRLTELASWVEKNEPDTYSFVVHRGLDHDDEVRIFERYASREALVKHQTAEPVLGFYRASKDLIRSMEGHGYVPNGLGWLHR